MSRAEKIKEQIGWLKVVFGLFTAVVISLTGYIATSYKIAEPFLLILALFLTAVFLYGIIVVNKKAFDKMDELEDM